MFSIGWASEEGVYRYIAVVTEAKLRKSSSGCEPIAGGYSRIFLFVLGITPLTLVFRISIFRVLLRFRFHGILLSF